MPDVAHNNLVLEIRAIAQGVKEGVNAANKELEKIKDIKNIDIKVDASGVEHLKAHLEALKLAKKDLEGKLEIAMGIEDIKRAEQELESLNKQLDKSQKVYEVLEKIGLTKVFPKSAEDLRENLEQNSVAARELEKALESIRNQEGVQFYVKLDEVQEAEKQLEQLYGQLEKFENADNKIGGSALSRIFSGSAKDAQAAKEETEAVVKAIEELESAIAGFRDNPQSKIEILSAADYKEEIDKLNQQIEGIETEIKLKVSTTGDIEGIRKVKDEVSQINKNVKLDIEAKGATETGQQLNVINESLKEIDKRKESLKELKKARDALKEKIKIGFDDSAVNDLKKRLAELKQEKADLQLKIKVPVDVSEISKVEKEIKAAKEQLEAWQAVMQNPKLNDMSKLGREVESNIEKVKESIKELEDKKISLETEVNTDELKAELAVVNSQIEEIDKELKIQIETSGAAEAESQLKKLDTSIKETEASTKKLEQSTKALAISSTAAFATLVLAVKKGTDAYNQSISALNGLRSKVDEVGESMSDALDLVREKTADGLITESDVSKAIQNLLDYGYTLEEASQILDRLKDKAANNRKEQYNLGEAVRVTTEGIKNNSSALFSAAGITANLSNIYKDYADTLGKTADSLTEAEKAQAVFAGIMKETEGSLGNAAQYAETLAGSQDKAAASNLSLAKSFGESLAPSVTKLNLAYSSVTDALTKFVQGNQSATAGLAAMATTALGIISAIAAVTLAVNNAKKAVDYFNLSVLAGPLGGVAIAASAVVGVFAVFASEAEKARKKQDELNQAAEKFNNLISQEVTDTNFGEKSKHYQDMQETKLMLQSVIAEYDNYINKKQEAASSTDEFFDQAAEVALAEAGITELASSFHDIAVAAEEAGLKVDDSLEFYEQLVKWLEAIEGPLDTANSQFEVYNQKKQKEIELAQRQDLDKQIKGLENLGSAYRSLSEGQELSLGTLLDLIDTYPDLARHIAENSDLTLENGEIVRQVMESEKEHIKGVIQAEITLLEGSKKTAEQRLKATQDMYDSMLEAAKIYYGAFGSVAGIAIDQTMKVQLLQQQAAVESLNDAIDNARAKIKAIDSISAGGGAGGRGSSAASNAKALTTEYEKQIKLLEERKSLTELSADEELQALMEIKANYAKNADEMSDIDKKLYSARSKANQEWLAEEIKAIDNIKNVRSDLVDYDAIVEATQQLKDNVLEVYADYPQTIKSVWEQITQIEEQAIKEQGIKNVNLIRDNIDSQVSEYNRMIELLRAQAGLQYYDDEGTLLTFEFGSGDELELLRELMAQIDSQIQMLVDSVGGNFDLLSEEHKALYDSLLSQLDSYTHQAQILQIKAQKESQKAYEDYLKQQEKAAQTANKNAIQAIKDRYAEEIKAAQEAADAQIAIYRERIKAIEDLLKQLDRQSADEDQLDKIRRLEEQLKYEIDESNQYELQKQIAQEQADYEKRKNKERLEDDKAFYQEQISLEQDNLAERKKQLEELRDAEIKAIEQAEERYKETLAKRSADYIEHQEKVGQIDAEFQAERLEALRKHNKELYKENSSTVEETRKLVDRGTSNIINDLISRIPKFAEAGRRAGAAYAEAYNAAIGSMKNSANLAYIGASYMAQQQAQMQNQTQPVTLEFTQVIQSQVASPSETARATKNLLEDALKFM